MAIPEWLPDWRDLTKYPDPKSASPTQFAWEFLRRNPVYQKDYENVWGSLSEEERKTAEIYSPPTNENESVAEYRVLLDKGTSLDHPRNSIFDPLLRNCRIWKD